jgi:tetratricopeptide (TPR) repeat protein
VSLERLRTMVAAGRLEEASARRVWARVEAGVAFEEALREEQSPAGTIATPSAGVSSDQSGSEQGASGLSVAWRGLGVSSLLLHADRWRPDPTQRGIAVDAALGRELRVRRARGEPARALRHEAEVLARLNHPVVPPLLEFGVDVEEHTVLVTAPCPGAPLAEDLGAGLPRILRALSEVALALAYARQQGVERSTISSQDVILGPHGETRLRGWARARLTSEPEQGAGALGALLEEVLGGKGPRELRSLAEVARGLGLGYDEFADELQRYLSGELLRSHRYGLGARAARWLRARPRGVVVFSVTSLLALGSALPLAGFQVRRQRSEAAQGVANARAQVAEKERALEAEARQQSTAAAALTRARILAAAEARSVIERDLARSRLDAALEPLLEAEEGQLRLEGARLLLMGDSLAAARAHLVVLSKDSAPEVRVGALLLIHVLEIEASALVSWPDSAQLRGELQSLPGDPLGLASYARALEELRAGDREAALAVLGEYRPQSRWHFPGLLLRARLRRELGGDLELAEKDAQAAANLAPQAYCLPGLLEFATLCDLRNQTRRARGVRDDVLSFAGRAGRLARLGTQSIRAGKPERAVEVLRGALESDPRLAFLMPTLAEALFRTGQRQEAIALLERAIEELPHPYDAHLALAEEGVIKGEVDLAETHIQRALSISPRLPRAFFLWGHVYAQRGDREAAIRAFEDCLGLDPPESLAAPARSQIRRLR